MAECRLSARRPSIGRAVVPVAARDVALAAPAGAAAGAPLPRAALPGWRRSRCRARDSAPRTSAPDGRSGCGSRPGTPRCAAARRRGSAALDEVLLPWCGTISTSLAQRRAERLATSAASCSRSMSPVSSTLRPPPLTRSTHDIAFGLRGARRSRRRAGCRTSKSTPSQRQRWPATQRRRRGRACRAADGRPRASSSSASTGSAASSAPRAADVVAVAVAEHQQVDARSPRARSSGTQHALAGVALARVLRAAVEDAAACARVRTSTAVPWPTSAATRSNCAVGRRATGGTQQRQQRAAAPSSAQPPRQRQHQQHRAEQAGDRAHAGAPRHRPDGARQRRPARSAAPAPARPTRRAPTAARAAMPSSASGVMTSVTSGIATRLASEADQRDLLEEDQRQRRQAERRDHLRAQPPRMRRPGAPASRASRRGAVARVRGDVAATTPSAARPPRTTARSPAAAAPTDRAP